MPFGKVLRVTNYLLSPVKTSFERPLLQTIRAFWYLLSAFEVCPWDVVVSFSQKLSCYEKRCCLPFSFRNGVKFAREQRS